MKQGEECMKFINPNNDVLKEGPFFEMDFNIDLSRFKGENGEINTVSDLLEDIDYDSKNDASYLKGMEDDIGFNYYSAKKMESIEREYKDYYEKLTHLSSKGYAVSFRKKMSIISFLIYTTLGSTVWSEIVFLDKNFSFNLIAGIVFGFYGWFMTYKSDIGDPNSRGVGYFINSCMVIPHIVAAAIYLIVTFILWLFQPDGWLHWLVLIGFIAFALFLCFILLISKYDELEKRWNNKQQEKEREAEAQENKKRIPRIAELVVEQRVEGTEFEFDSEYIEEYTNEIIEFIEANYDINYYSTNAEYAARVIKLLEKNDRKRVWEQSQSPETMKMRAENIADLVVERRVQGTEFEFNEEYIDTYTREILNLIDKHITISKDFSDQEYVEYIIELIEKHERKMAWEEEGI